GAALEGGEQGISIGNQQVGGAGHLHREGGVENVRGGHALVHEAGVGADDFAEVGQEGDDVVLGGALDLVDARDVKAVIAMLGLAGIHHVPDVLGALFRHHAQFGELGGGVGLDLEPDGKARFGGPDGHHFGAGIARDHGLRLSGSIIDSGEAGGGRSAGGGHGGGVGLDLEPDGKARFGGPDGHHFGAGIARDHGLRLSGSIIDSGEAGGGRSTDGGNAGGVGGCIIAAINRGASDKDIGAGFSHG